MLLPAYYNIVVSLLEVGVISGVFLARYRSKKTRVNWKITLAETVAIVIIATVVSLLLGAIYPVKLRDDAQPSNTYP